MVDARLSCTAPVLFSCVRDYARGHGPAEHEHCSCVRSQRVRPANFFHAHITRVAAPLGLADAYA